MPRAQWIRKKLVKLSSNWHKHNLDTRTKETSTTQMSLGGLGEVATSGECPVSEDFARLLNGKLTFLQTGFASTEHSLSKCIYGLFMKIFTRYKKSYWKLESMKLSTLYLYLNRILLVGEIALLDPRTALVLAAAPSTPAPPQWWDNILAKRDKFQQNGINT